MASMKPVTSLLNEVLKLRTAVLNAPRLRMSDQGESEDKANSHKVMDHVQKEKLEKVERMSEGPREETTMPSISPEQALSDEATIEAAAPRPEHEENETDHIARKRKLNPPNDIKNGPIDEEPGFIDPIRGWINWKAVKARQNRPKAADWF